MNFNDINGVWPLIKDYIDSKLGGGESKYKHMIYVTNLYKMLYPVDAQSSISGSITSFLSNGYYAVLQNRFAICCTNNYFDDSVEHPAFEIVNGMKYYETTFGNTICLKEGWYINYCGQIYDYQGNIVE